jgi:integrase/recombinase XerD
VTEEVLREFLAYVSSERALATNTRLAYEQDLTQFLQFCFRKNINAQHVSLHDLRDFLASLRRQSLSPRSIARKVSALKQFYKFQLRENKIQEDPSELLTVIVKTKKLPKHLTIQEMFLLIASAEGNTESEIRDRAILEFWYATGCRVSELINMPVHAIDWEEGVVKLLGKGSKERIVPLTHDAIAWCKKYKDIRHQWLLNHNLKDSKTFFLTRLGGPFTRQGIWKVVKKYAKQAGLTKNIWPHMIRHSFATHILRGGADLRAVQELLGHRSITTTEVYTHLDVESLKQMQLKYHPRD